MRKLVQVAPPGDIIPDPFAGSGTTCLAAFPEGRNFLGIDMDPGYSEVARNRLRLTVNGSAGPLENE